MGPDCAKAWTLQNERKFDEFSLRRKNKNKCTSPGSGGPATLTNSPQEECRPLAICNQTAPEVAGRGSDCDSYLVEKLTSFTSVGGKIFYQVKWKGYEGV